MRVDLRGAARADARMTSRRALPWSWGLAVLVVVAAGVCGAIRFTGPRWRLNERASPASPHRAPPPRVRATPSSGGGGGIPQWLVWIIVAVVAIALVTGLVLLLLRWWSGRRSRAERNRRPIAAAATAKVVAEPESEPEAPVVQSGIERALEALWEQREPADAVVRAWLGLEETAGDSGIVRAPAETPTEFTSRIVSRVVSDDRPVRTLLRLYLRTRFGDHPVTDEDVSAVRSALQKLVRTWSAPPPAIRSGSR